MVSQTSTLVSLQEQINGIRSDIFGLNAGLSNIGTLIRNDSALETIRLREEEQQERALLQQQVRVGKETEIERRIDDSIAAPIESVESKVNDTFGGIEAALTALFFGTFSAVAVKGISFVSNDLSKTIDKTKEILNNTLGFVTDSIESIGNGFNSVFDVIGNITSNVSNIASSLIKSPIEAISKAFGGLFGGSVDGKENEPGFNSQNFYGVLKDFSSSFSPAAPPSSPGVDVSFNENSGASVPSPPAQQSKPSSFNIDSFIPGMSSAMMNSPVFKTMFEQLNQSKITMSNGENERSVGVSNFNINIPDSFSNITDNFSSMMTGVRPSESESPGTPKSLTIDGNSKVIPLQVEPYKPPTQQKTELKPPEKKPDVIYTSSISQQQGQQTSTMTSTEDIPFIPSSNPDNFYVLYSQLNYNVVM